MAIKDVMKNYPAEIKKRDKCSQMTGYKRITEYQFIITSFDDHKNKKVEIIGRWFSTKVQTIFAATNWARSFNINLIWKKQR